MTVVLKMMFLVLVMEAMIICDVLFSTNPGSNTRKKQVYAYLPHISQTIVVI